MKNRLSSRLLVLPATGCLVVMLSGAPARGVDNDGILGGQPILGGQEILGADPMMGTPPIVGSEPIIGAEPLVGGEPMIDAEPIVGAAPMVGAEPLVSDHFDSMDLPPATGSYVGDIPSQDLGLGCVGGDCASGNCDGGACSNGVCSGGACGGGLGFMRGICGGGDAVPGGKVIGRGYGRPDLFYNFYTQGYVNRINAQMYLSPLPIPPNVGHTFYTYQPFYPHHMLYWHKNRFHRYYDNGRGMNRTKAVYYAPPIREAAKSLYWNWLRIPR